VKIIRTYVSQLRRRFLGARARGGGGKQKRGDSRSGISRFDNNTVLYFQAREAGLQLVLMRSRRLG
jgi:hypothetical protein